MRRYLLVANQTATGSRLKQVVSDLMSQECRFSLVVPATPPTDHLVFTEGTAQDLAQRRLDEALDELRGLGADVTGWVGDADPYQAIADALRGDRYDEVILSTFPPGVSRWLRTDIESRVRSGLGVPVRVVHSRRVSVQAR